MSNILSGLLHFAQALLLFSLPAFVIAEGSSDDAAGATSPTRADRNLFKQPTRQVKKHQRMDFVLGEAIFEKFWVSSPASTKSSDGLGPLYNARSCHQCHIGNGRGVVLNDDGSAHASLVVKFYNDKLRPEPVYGRQLQPFSVTGHRAEGRIAVRYSDQAVTLNDGTIVTLREPRYELEELQLGEVSPGTLFSYRIAPPLPASGVIDRIPADLIQAQADPEDKDNNGISGRVRQLTDRVTGEPVTGRFGWKAEQADTVSQNSDALLTDMGLSSPHFDKAWGDCSESQSDCRAAPHGADMSKGEVEVSAELTKVLSVYVNGLSVPEQRNINDTDVQAGENLFRTAGCVLCHRESYTIRDAAKNRDESLQLWSDLLLHDMGERLADSRQGDNEFAREWRTQPLLGVGLTQRVEPAAGFLHDGRARTLLEAILWHGGEAEASRRSVMAMDRAERQQLIKFLESL